MNLSLAELPLPLRLRPATALTDEELLDFCATNGDFRIEQEPTGELIVMTPPGSESSGQREQRAARAAAATWT